MGFLRRGKRSTVRGTAQVVSSSAPPPNSVSATLRMTLVVQAPGVPPTSTTYVKRVVRCAKFPVPGQQIPVEVDPSDPTEVSISWKEMPTRSEMASAQGQALAASLGSSAPPSVPPPTAAIVDQLRNAFPGAHIEVDGSATGSGPDERVAQLERLVALRDAGALTPEEFEREKSRILTSED